MQLQDAVFAFSVSNELQYSTGKIPACLHEEKELSGVFP